jgi:ferredoxin-type protein NapF
MNLTSYFANKCFEYLLKCDAEQEEGKTFIQPQERTQSPCTSITPIQPPWAKNSKTFQSFCDGCGNCVSACENRILVLNENGYPQVDFSKGSCSFCGACAESCTREALQNDTSNPPWNIYAHINSRCLINNMVICSTCVEQCDKEAIVLPKFVDRDKAPRVLTELCNGCGACFNSCPVHAIDILNRTIKSNPNEKESL